MDEFFHLFFRNFCQIRPAVTQGIYGDSRTKVQVFIPRLIPEVAPLPFFHHKKIRGIIFREGRIMNKWIDRTHGNS